MSRSTTRIVVVRRIDADPASTALLLAGPTAVDLWPGARRVGSLGGHLLVAASDAVSTSAVSVTAHPPRRTPTSFVSSFSWSGPDVAVTSVDLRLGYASGGEGVPATTAELVLEVADPADSAFDVVSLTAMAEGFLANLADAAEARRAA